MKMNKFAVIALIIALVAGGCSADKVSAPTATAAVGSAANVQVTLSSGAIASGGNVTVTATVTDNTSLVVPNATVSFSVISSTYGTFSPTSATTDASGNAVSTFTAGSSVNANATIMATVTVGTSQISGSAQLTIGTPPRTPTSVTVTLNPTSIAPSGSTTVSATVSDATGGISGQSVTFSLSDSAAGNLSATSATTNASGLATVTFTANAVNQYVEITATAGTLSNSAMLQIGTPPPPVAASIAISIDQLSISIGSYATVSVLLLDSSNNPAFGSSVTLQITSGPSDASFAPISQPTLTSITVTTNSSGIATAILYAGDISGTVVVSATDGSLLPVTASLPITSDPARISLTITNSSLTSGQTTNITAQVLNAANAPVSEGTAVTFTLSGTAGSI
jgi:adhesin/invasin